MILITGATGNIGSAALSNLLAKGQVCRATAINSKDASRVPEGVESVIFDFANPDTYGPALEGVQKIFLMRPPQITDTEHTLNPFIDAAREAGVEHIVFLSLLGIENNTRVPHYAVEQHLKQAGVLYTFLRPSFFMQNLNNATHSPDIRNRDRIYIPAADAKTSFLDARDIGAVAAQVLTESGHENQAYELTGPEALDYYSVAEIMSEVLGRKIEYANPSPLAFVWHTWRQGTELVYTLVMSMLYRETRNGLADTVNGEVERLIGRKPTPLSQYVEDYQSVWQPNEA